MQEQDRQQRALLPTGERKLTPVVCDLERAEDAEVQILASPLRRP
jgi:hypothetical protein